MPARKKYDIIRSAMLLQLGKDLPVNLLYHSIEHTIDVEMQAERIANENACSREDLFRLKLACLYHDSGFLFTYNDHEEAGCNLARKELPAFGVAPGEIAIICGLIRATRIPQTPLCKLEEIICDADLDYLGRPDFFSISNCLFFELKARDLVKSENEWNLIQINFFKKHTYFTASSKQLREPLKQRHLQIITSLAESGS